MNTSTLKRFQRRSSRRGAALVEAAVVLPSMLVFLGCIVFAHDSYNKKLEMQTGTRSSALYFASHNCTGAVPAGITQVDDGAAGDNPLAAGDLGKAGGATQAPGVSDGLSQKSSYAHATPKDTPVYGKAVTDGRTIQLNRQVHAESEVHCNEKTFPNKWTAVFKYIGSAF